MKKPYYSDDGILYFPDGPDDFDIDYVPNSWVDENGVRHAVVWDEDVETRYKLEDCIACGKPKVLVEDVMVF